MCGRFTVKATWAELVAMYRLTMDAPPHNLRPRYNVCDIQRPRGDGREKARLPRRVQAPLLPDPDVRVLRVAEHPERKTTVVLHRPRWVAGPHRSGSLG